MNFMGQWASKATAINSTISHKDCWKLFYFYPKGFLLLDVPVDLHYKPDFFLMHVIYFNI